METFINQFHENTDDLYNNFIELNSFIKEYEFSILEKIDINRIIAYTDSIMSELLNTDIDNIKDIHIAAKKALKEGNKKEAVKLMSEILYKIEESSEKKLIGRFDPELEYSKLVDALINIDELKKNITSDEISKFVKLCEHHIRSLREHIDQNNRELIEKELNLSNMLINQIFKILAKHKH